MNHIKAFFEKAMVDEKIMAKLNELGEKAQDEEIIALASQHGFTITKDEIENAKNQIISSGELNEEELEKVAGGGATRNRYDPNVCPTLKRLRGQCISNGFLPSFLLPNWCDHYRRREAGPRSTPTGQMIKMYYHSCAMGAFGGEEIFGNHDMTIINNQ